MSKQYCDTNVIEVYLDTRESIIVDMIDDTNPQLIQIGIGTSKNLMMMKRIIQIIIDSCHNISGIVLPENIPTYLIEVLYPLITINAKHYYTQTDATGLDVGAYSLLPGKHPSEINLHHKFDQHINDKDCNHIQMSQFKTPMPVGTFDTIEIDYSGTTFHPLKDVDDVSDGFHPIEDGSLDDIVDGFHDIQIEKRSMWTEDPVRMNRLSYLPIAAINGDSTFPEPLGGGLIR